MSETIQRIIAQLDAAVPKDGARVKLSQDGAGIDEPTVTATQQGILRLGIEFLRAAYAPASEQAPSLVAIDLDYLLTDDSDLGFNWFERVATMPTATSASRSSAFSSCFGITVGVVLGSIFLVGFGAILAWIFGW